MNIWVNIIAIGACAMALWLIRENERLSSRIEKMTAYNMREATYQRGTKTVHVQCLGVYTHKSVENAIVVEIDKLEDKTGSVYSIPIRRLAWVNETTDDVHM